MRAALTVAAAVAAASTAAASARADPPPSIAWAEAQARSHLAVDLTDYFGLTLRFVSAGAPATCSAVARGTFRCTTRLRADEGPKFPGSVTARFLLRRGPDLRPRVTAVRVLSCRGIVCPIH